MARIFQRLRGSFALAGLFVVLSGASAQSCYELVWSEEFNYSGRPDSSIWTHETGAGGWGNNELQHYTSRTENSRVEGGNLVIEARKESYEGSAYTSARLISYPGGHTFQYGKIEARMKLPYGQGIWPAFWMLGSSFFEGTSWPACGEIDIMEMVGGGSGRDDVTHGTIHWQDASGNHASYGGSKQLVQGIFADDYHLFSITWDAGMIRWYLDGVQYHQVSISPAELDEFRKEFFLILNVAVGGNWPGSPDATTVFPQQMLVDFIRVYQLDNVPEITGDTLVVPAARAIPFSTVESEDFTYTWSVPEGASIVGRSDSSTVFVDWGCDSGTVHCTVTGLCDNYELSHHVGLAELEISGKTKVEPFEQNLEFTVPATSEASYTWMLPRGVELQSAADSNAIMVNWNDTTGIIHLHLTNHCGLDSAGLKVEMVRQLPYPNPDQPHQIPGSIESVHYDSGGEGLAYHDFEAENLGPGSRQDEGVDTEPNDGGETIGWLEYGEWLEYTIEVAENASYDLQVRVGSPNPDGMFHILFNGEDRTGVLSVPRTGSWTAFTTISVRDLELSTEDSIMRIQIDNGQFNMGRLTFTEATSVSNKDHEEGGKLLIYPLPARKELFVKGLAQSSFYTILDQSGRLLHDGRLEPGQPLEVAYLEAGMYFLVLDPDRVQSTVLKFIISGEAN